MRETAGYDGFYSVSSVFFFLQHPVRYDKTHKFACKAETTRITGRFGNRHGMAGRALQTGRAHNGLSYYKPRRRHNGRRHDNSD